MAEENKNRLLISWAVSQGIKALKSFLVSLQHTVLSVKVENQPDHTGLLKEVATNTRGVKGKLDELIRKDGVDLTKRIDELINIGKRVEKKEQPAVVIPPFPTELRVSNLHEIKIPTSVQEKYEKVDISPLEKQLKDLKSSFQDIVRLLPSLKSEKVTIPNFPEPKPFPKQISIAEGKDITEEIVGLRADVEQLYTMLSEKEFGGNGSGKVEVTNFPPQSIPTPVTNININALRGLVKTTAFTSTSTASQVPATPLDQRRSLIIYNISSTTVYFGGEDVTIANGIPILANSTSPSIDAGDHMKIFVISASPATLRVMEVSNDQEGN